jgi:hypothetical protein
MTSEERPDATWTLYVSSQTDARLLALRSAGPNSRSGVALSPCPEVWFRGTRKSREQPQPPHA